jgi:4-hydroxy-tetrahydrodipicolinate reductase
VALNIIISGALGRMGIEIANIVLADEALKLFAVVEYSGHSQIGSDYGTCIGKGPLGISVLDSIDDIDFTNSVLIDFSSPNSSRALLEKAPAQKIKMVVGTTGLGSEDLLVAQKSAQSVALLVSPNMSLGVNLLFFLTQQVASTLKDKFDIEIIEAHHRFKKDAPSGTAKRLGEVAAEALGFSYDEIVQDGRSGISDKIRPVNEIGMHAVRGGDIVGDHTVLFAGIGERLELRHIAHSRSTFAQGAVTAAKWLANQENGLYSMRDVLGL